MNSTTPEVLHCLNTPGNVAATTAAAMKDTDMSITLFERQRAAMKWQQEQLQLDFLQQQQQSYFDEFHLFSSPAQAQAQSFPALINGPESALYQILTRPIKPDPCVENGWPDFNRNGITSEFHQSFAGYANGSSGYGVNYAISRTTSCPPAVAPALATKEAVKTAEAKGGERVTSEKLSATYGRGSSKKRKAEKNPTPKRVDTEEDNRTKRVCAEEGESKKADQQQNGNEYSNRYSSSSSSNKGNNENKKDKEASGCTSKENSKVSEVQKPEYIHVRARRGQATDSHSLAERVRREKISARMKYLQDLVPGCSKITGKAGMLDEIINYVQSLQRELR
ncbi:hypothetical protein Ancab_018098 [Ancistrocladus abbreviatus]